MEERRESRYGEKAVEYFAEGYNCAQSVFLAFADLYEDQVDRETAALLASGFGGGMGGLREMCGAVSGMFLAADLLYGHKLADPVTKMNLKYRLQELAGAFQKENGSYLCRELLSMPQMPGQAGSVCDRAVYSAAAILEAYMEKEKKE